MTTLVFDKVFDLQSFSMMVVLLLLLYENEHLLIIGIYLLSSLAWLMKQPANLSQPKNFITRKCLLPKHTCYVCINQSENDYKREKKVL